MKQTTLALFSVGALLCASSLFASPIDVPDGDPLALLLSLAAQWRVIAPLVRGMMIIMILVQGLKKFAPGFRYLKIVVALGGVVYAVLQSLASGYGIAETLVTVLLVFGGAIAIYQSFKAPLNSVFQVKK